VQFIVAVGGYHDLRRVLSFFTTGYFYWEGEWLRMEPNEYGKWIFIRSNEHRVVDVRDRKIFRRMADRKLDDPHAEIDALANGLGPEGRKIYDFVTNRDPGRVTRLIAALPDPIRTEIDALDLARRDLSRLKARLILLHGYDDDIIPYVESLSLARAAADAELFLVRGLVHVDLAPRWRDFWRLWRAVALLLAQRAD
jgi:pimeloyl-ACP methyl ester carboxylesterase